MASPSRKTWYSCCWKRSNGSLSFAVSLAWWRSPPTPIAAPCNLITDHLVVRSSSRRGPGQPFYWVEKIPPDSTHTHNAACHRVGRVLSFFSSRRNWDPPPPPTPHPQASMLPSLVPGENTLASERGVHCEKSLFVLASHQKIPVLRTENPAVDTRTICLPPIEFF